MFTAEELHYLRELYANIFKEDANNSLYLQTEFPIHLE
jgi:hypothetical protein